ncbi:MAG: GMP/IMP nucleotidase [Gammaproteobacteria bacterium]|nr:GMP/IMP nucleotidase [Gammaproteobacteria bacterium]MDH5261593.1 GMP/IMP nucleotidase [Gammaproteobacteria bacterium]MDH5582688.1 GMP/IMP nucleotidase [Gammaproteobacteria bacterium]
MDPQSALRQTATLMLDMDGTLLDLAFDNYIWKELVPRRYAVEKNMTYEEARALLTAKYAAVQGDLEWYCLDHWCDRLGMDVVQLHHDMSHRIGYLPGALEFLRRVQEQNIRVLLVTNAHPDTLALKDAMTGLGDYFDGLHSSHTYGYAKESQNFWSALQEEVGFDRDTTLFVDDSLPVLRSAKEYGIGMLVSVTQPDTTEPERPTTEFRSVQRVADLLDIG